MAKHDPGGELNIKYRSWQSSEPRNCHLGGLVLGVVLLQLLERLAEARHSDADDVDGGMVRDTVPDTPCAVYTAQTLKIRRILIICCKFCGEVL